MTDYATLEALNARAGTLGEALSILHWDQQAMMPAGGNESRGEQTALLETMIHEIAAGPAMGEAIEAASAQNDLDPWQRANVAESRRRYLRATALPADLVAAKARAESQAFAVWQQARPADDFAAALPSLRLLRPRTTGGAGHRRRHRLAIVRGNDRGLRARLERG